MISGYVRHLCLSIVVLLSVFLCLRVAVGALVVPNSKHQHQLIRCSRSYWYLRAGLALPPTRSKHQLHAVSKKEEQSYWKLPRLYVMSNNKMQENARIPLSQDQIHYLTNVMRILKKRNNNSIRRQKQQSNSEDEEDINISRDCIRIFNGEDGEWLARVHDVSSQQQSGSESTNVSGKSRSKKTSRSRKQREDASLIAECIVQLRTQDYNKDDRPWIMFVPLKKQHRMKNMIEKCTELGVGRLIPVSSDRMEGGAAFALLGSKNNHDPNIDMIYGGTNNEELRSKLVLQAIEASEQCERLDIPIISTDLGCQGDNGSIDELTNIQDIVKQWCVDWEEKKESRVLLICRERGDRGEDVDEGRARIVPVLQALNDNKHVSFIIGPEGGWSQDEEDLFDKVCSEYSGMQNGPVQCVSLGSSVLRAETASMLAVGAWSLLECDGIDL